VINYKKFIRSRELRIKIMQFFSFIPDKTMVKMQYFLKTGCFLNIKNPRKFTEKIQIYKLFYRDPLMKECVDKYEVRKYVKDCGLARTLNECYGVYNSPEEIDFSKLPQSFVLKDTLGGGGNSIIIVKNKENLDVVKIQKQMKEWVERPVEKKHPGREWVYEGRKHRIIAERYIEASEKSGGLIDYKFFCSYGEVKCMYVIADREMGKKAGLGIFDAEYKRINANRSDEEPLSRDIPKPENFEEMKAVAQKLSAAFPEARIDLYNIDNKIIFGEITFFDGSGYMTFEPKEFDFAMGEMFEFRGGEQWER